MSDNKSSEKEIQVEFKVERKNEESVPPEVKQLTQSHGSQLRKLFTTYVRRHWPERTPPKVSDVEPPRITGLHGSIISFLRVIPWVLFVLFLIALFVWDFNGMQLQIGSYIAPLEGLLRILAVSGLIGFFTNWLAIAMLFRPRERRPLFGQGLIPAQRDRVIFRLAQTVSKELISADIIKQKIEESGIIPKYRDMAITVTHDVVADPDFRKDVQQLAVSYVSDVFGSKEVRDKLVDFVIKKIESYAGDGLGGLALKTYRMLNEDDFKRRIEEAVHQLPHSIDELLSDFDHVLDYLPEKLEARSSEIEEAVTRMIIGFVDQLDIYSMVSVNLEQYDERKLEELLKNTTNEQLNYIKYLGGILGCIGGLVIWNPVLALGGMLVVGLILYGLDVLLYTRRRSVAE